MLLTEKAESPNVWVLKQTSHMGATKVFNRINAHPTPMKPEMAAELAAQLLADDEDGNTYEVREYQGGRAVVAIVSPEGDETFF